MEIVAKISQKSIIEYNKEEIERELKIIEEKYIGLTFTEEQPGEAKEERAKLNNGYKRKNWKTSCWGFNRSYQQIWGGIEIKELIFNSEKGWLDIRKGKIGGSSIGTILGYNKYQTPYELWKELIGRKAPKDISDKPCIVRGKSAEKPLIQLYQALNLNE